MSGRESVSPLRSADLPNYDNPPVNEVVVGVQYAPPEGFSATNFGEVHGLFAAEFPKVEEKPWLEPKIETFGEAERSLAIAARSPARPVLPRLWFVSEAGDHLLQFQEDRFFLNWMRRGSGDEYPRFDSILDRFMNHLGTLRRYYRDRHGHHVALSQAEVMYVNTIPVSSFGELSRWISGGLPGSGAVHSLNFSSEEVMCDKAGQPTQRFYAEIVSTHAKEGEGKAYRLSLTVRGIPCAEGDAASIDLREYLSTYRRKIVETFDSIITDHAKNEWGRQP